MSGDKGELLHLHFCFITYSLTLGNNWGYYRSHPTILQFLLSIFCCQHVNSVIWKGDQPGLEPRAFEFVPQCASATPLAWSETYNSITSSGQELAVFIVLLTGSWLRLLTSDNVSDDTALGNAYSAITVFTILQYFSVPFVHFCICFLFNLVSIGCWAVTYTSDTVSQIQSDCGSSDTFLWHWYFSPYATPVLYWL